MLSWFPGALRWESRPHPVVRTQNRAVVSEARPLKAQGLLHLVSVELMRKLWAPRQAAHRQCMASRPFLSCVSSVLSRSIGGLSRVDVKWIGSVPARSTFGFSCRILLKFIYFIKTFSLSPFQPFPFPSFPVNEGKNVKVWPMDWLPQ